MVKRLTAMLAMLVLVLAARAQGADTEKAIADVSAKVNNALAILTFKIHLETGDTPAGGQAICIDPGGVFMTTVLDPAMRADMVREMKLTMPGRDGKVYDAKFLGVEPASGLGFVQAEGTKVGDFGAVEFVEQPKLAIGQQVVSVGVMGGDGNRTTYLGSAHVSAILHVPSPLIYVTGGRLTNICSPVLTADGKGVGIVARQLPLAYGQLDTGKGMLNIPVRSEEESGFFIPSDEFFYAIKKENIPKGGEPKRQGWIGVNGFIPVSEEKAKIEGIELPAVMCDGVIPKHPAAEAGIKDTDIILEINGQKLERLANPAFTVQNFMRQIMKFQIGQKVELTVKSGAQKKKITLTVGPMPTLPPEAPRIYDQLLGMLLRERVPLDQYLMKGQASEKEGLIVIAIQKGSLADLYGLSGGDIVIAVNDQPVKTRDAYKAFGDGFFKNNQPVKLKIFRQNQELTIAILPPRQPSGG